MSVSTSHQRQFIKNLLKKQDIEGNHIHHGHLAVLTVRGTPPRLGRLLDDVLTELTSAEASAIIKRLLR